MFFDKIFPAVGPSPIPVLAKFLGKGPCTCLVLGHAVGSLIMSRHAPKASTIAFAREKSGSSHLRDDPPSETSSTLCSITTDRASPTSSFRRTVKQNEGYAVRC
jgi:hypothetical protein